MASTGTIHHVTTYATPPSEPAWWTSECTCGLRKTSRTSPDVAEELVELAHVRRGVAAQMAEVPA